MSDIERLGELLFILSGHLLRVGALSDKETHIAYENVVGEYNLLADKLGTNNDKR